MDTHTQLSRRIHRAHKQGSQDATDGLSIKKRESVLLDSRSKDAISASEHTGLLDHLTIGEADLTVEFPDPANLEGDWLEFLQLGELPNSTGPVQQQ